MLLLRRDWLRTHLHQVRVRSLMFLSTTGIMKSMLWELPLDLLHHLCQGELNELNPQKIMFNHRHSFNDEQEKLSLPPSYSAVVQFDEDNDNHDNEVTEAQVTIDIIQSDGLPTYDDACRMNNINNNYI